jgi:hypothetical protein
VLGSFLALSAIAIVLGVVLVVGGGGDGTVTTVTEPAVTEPTVPETSLAPGLDVNSVVAGFAAAWAGGEWTTLTELSNDSVAATARDWYVDGLSVEVVEPITEVGGELLVSDPGGGHGLIFRLEVDSTQGTVRVTNLVFGGDAG